MIAMRWQMNKVLTKLGEGGRLVIPAEYRKALGVEVGDEVVLMLEEGSLRILTPQEGVRRAQELVRSYIPNGQRLADELIADRRKESRGE
jgi:bifunctional DNA-binding transcriptional regulator/antitoxin component of YhaV-PrlF toxin-antitoxin module